MGTQLLIELPNKEGAQVVFHALESYKARLQAGIERTKRRLGEFEQRYQVSTDYFLKQMAAEDLAEGDLEYVEWSGEAHLLKSLEKEFIELEHVHYKLP
ncbi:MAG: hypothetical protein HY879_06185 [Deltaproteobacteria bacterium]|nr:hypothetical protein [Deltaproteobacteria bacterium]